MSANQLDGGWTPFITPIPQEDLDVFNTAMKQIMGVDYQPLAVATQVVAGTNYRFFCNSKVVYPHSPNEARMVQIWQNPEGVLSITSIEKV
jgi:hypothetical protein